MDERVIVSRDPLNAETRLELQEGIVTPASRHYVRSHFAFPRPSPRSLAIGGAVRSPRSLTVADLRALPARTATVTLECAGNGRSFLRPPAPGEQWRLGAVSTAEWTGVALRSLLEPGGLAGAVEILFRGADRGAPADLGREIAFERSLPLARALADDVLVAYAMNGGPIPEEHGAPLRLVVPAWYGMASVKWLAEIVALETPFRGFYQADRYVIGDEPLGAMHPRAVIVAPFGTVRAGAAATVRGYAWSGQAIARVELSVDGGASWREARLGPERGAAAWREWQAEWTPPSGTHELLAQATDVSGETQPVEQRRNALGYANNAAQPERVVAR